MGFNSKSDSIGDINEGVKIWQTKEGAVLLDVRTEDEYKQGHIEGSMNHPLVKITTIGPVLSDKNVPLYVHCLSGARSARAVDWLMKAGYADVTNIGGIRDYKGPLVK